jgi:hypothetical protein
MKGVGSGFNSDTGWGYDCLNTIMFGVGAGASGYVAMQRPNPTWNNLLKLKVYTNLLTDFGGATMGLTQGSTVNLYEAGTTNAVGVVGSSVPMWAFPLIGSGWEKMRVVLTANSMMKSPPLKEQLLTNQSQQLCSKKGNGLMKDF